MSSASRKANAAGFFALLVGGTLAAFLPAMLATREIRGFCEALAPDTTIPALQLRAQASGYRFARSRGAGAGGHVIVEHPRSLGRAYCDVEFDGTGRLISKSADH